MERRTLIYTIILILLVAALATVGVLILRKRLVMMPRGVTGGVSSKRLPTDTKAYNSLPKEDAWRSGVPIPTTGFDLYQEVPGSPE